MLRIVISDASVEEVNINGRNGSFKTRRQSGFMELPNGERRKIRIRLPEGRSYAAGSYTLGDGSFTVGEYGDLKLGTLELLAVPVAVPGSGKAA